jgi:DNA-binding YbaB/EbfC family protein
MDMMKMMQQAKEMQDRMTVMQQELEHVEVEGQSGGGMVTVTMTCKGHMRGIKLSPEIITPEDPEMLEDLIVAAVNDAKSKGDATLADLTKYMMGSMGLPADIKLPF